MNTIPSTTEPAAVPVRRKPTLRAVKVRSLEDLPPTCLVTLYAEVENTTERYNPSLRASPDIRRLFRSPSRAAPSGLLRQVAQGLNLPKGALVWVACEAPAVREIRQLLLNERGVDRAQLVTRGYWKAGESDHPDHDMGD